MQRETFPVGPLQCNCSILYDAEANDATVIDPGGDVSRIVAFLTSKGLHLRQIVVTHAHLDHIAGAKTLSELTHALVYLHPADLELLSLMEQQAAWIGVPTPRVGPPDVSADDGLKLSVGQETGEVLYTPGHTPGSISLHFPASNLLIAGDTLFRGGIGRTDLWLGNDKLILQSIHERLLTLPETTVVVAGHGATTTIGREKESNPFLA